MASIRQRDSGIRPRIVLSREHRRGGPATTAGIHGPRSDGFHGSRQGFQEEQSTVGSITITHRGTEGPGLDPVVTRRTPSDLMHVHDHWCS